MVDGTSNCPVPNDAWLTRLIHSWCRSPIRESLVGLAGLLLLIAGGLKLLDPMPVVGMNRWLLSADFTALLGLGELIVGCALLFCRKSMVYRVGAMGMYAAFAVHNWAMLSSTQTSCGCLGTIEGSPATMLVIDCLMMSTLVGPGLAPIHVSTGQSSGVLCVTGQLFRGTSIALLAILALQFFLPRLWQDTKTFWISSGVVHGRLPLAIVGECTGLNAFPVEWTNASSQPVTVIGFRQLPNVDATVGLPVELQPYESGFSLIQVGFDPNVKGPKVYQLRFYLSNGEWADVTLFVSHNTLDNGG